MLMQHTSRLQFRKLRKPNSRSLNRQGFVVFLLAILLFVGCSPSEVKPNVIFIISDDQSYTDYGFMGHKYIETPYLDTLAMESLTFTRGYVTSPLCSPSLASIISGLYPFQHGITGNDPEITYVDSEGNKTIDASKENVKRLPRHITFKTLTDNYYKNKILTHTLAENGYMSFQTGKWWLGSAEDAGFTKGMTKGDHQFGNARQGDDGLKIGREGMGPIYQYIDEATAAEKPFFLWFAPYLPHKPHNPPQYLMDKYLDCAPSPSVAKYWAMVEWFDEITGQLLDYLKEKGIDENTIIVFTGDNGWIQAVHTPGYRPKSKRAPHEGGIRTPILFKYPNKIAAARNDTSLVSAIDIVPTVLSLVGIENKELPGLNVLDTVQLQNRKVVFSEAYDHDIKNVEVPTESLLYKIAIEKTWKLMVPNTNMLTKDSTTVAEQLAGYYSKEIQLFNLDEDRFERFNVADKYPAQVLKLQKAIDEWWQPHNPLQ